MERRGRLWIMMGILLGREGSRGSGFGVKEVWVSATCIPCLWMRSQNMW